MPERPANSESKRARGVKTTWTQFVAMVEWLENKDNFNLIVGRATSGIKTGMVAGFKLSKKAGYAELADFVNQKCNVHWDARNAEARLRAYIKRFKDTKRALLNQGGAKYCIGDKDRAKGINTIEAKLNDDCPYFKRMDALFGGRQNITPFSVRFGAKRPARLIEGGAKATEQGDEVGISGDDDSSESNNEDDVEAGGADVDSILDATDEDDEEDKDAVEDADDSDQQAAAKALTTLSGAVPIEYLEY